ncbi:TonB-dependent receptor [Horticoccus sp. 23ND18S-11]|uniref:TonB-dependent receptor n=1 Tax=Horticoccus sp. 23ND18S-11 TaxID=3391832 RepID=UPI0039C98D98
MTHTTRVLNTLRTFLRPALTLAAAFTVLAAPARAADSAGTGSISGYVSNALSRNLLEGARVEVPQLGLSAYTDTTGRFTLRDVPAGTHQVTASYIGLDPLKSDIAVAAGQVATRNFDLTTAIYQLDAFKVAGEREGNAAAITAQRNATNLKNVVAIDAYGNLPNMNASELAVLLPGVAGSLSDEGNIIGFTIRGMPPAMNSITIDGALMGSQGGMNRATRIHTITGSMFDALELTKGHTPDKEAGSLGGTVNLKSRSSLNLKEKRRVSYNFSARLAPPDTQQIPMREDHRIHPLLNVAYQEVFSVLGGERNLGVALNLFYSEQAIGFFSTTRDFQNVATTPAYVWDYRTQDNYNNRKQSSVNAKFDYQLSPNTKISLNLIYNDAFERFRLRYLFRAFTGNQNTVPNAASGVVPGFTDRVTQVRPIAASTIDITSQMSHFLHRQRHADIGAEQRFGPLELDYNAVVSLDHINGGGGDGGVLVNRATGIGWILDRRQSDLYPQFIQSGGPDISNPASYRPNSLNFADSHTIHEIREIRGNARYKLPTSFSLFAKTGFRLREEKAGDDNKDRRYTFTGTNSSQLPTDPTIKTFGDHKTGLNIPAWNANAISRARTPVDPTLWSEDRYFAESSKYIGTREVTETVTAGYVMAQGTVGRTGFLGGVRVEKTEDDSWGWVRSRVGSTAAQQVADPVGSAQRDYANTRREISGNYTKAFPSLHLTHDLQPNLKARLSWSNSFGRPPLSNLLPNETVNETAQTLTINNPSLKPQTAESWDASLEYYFEPVGSLSVAWFHKTIKDYFVNGVIGGTVGSGADNGYNGEYSGFTILTRENLGTAIVQGWEFSYQQQFTFLPGLLKGFGVSVNYTLLETRGNFGGTDIRRTGEVPGFVPRTANVSLSWRHGGFGTRIVANRTGEYINAFTATGSGRNQYTVARTIVNVGVAYQYRPWLSFSMDVGNIFNEPQVFYRGIADQISEVRIPGTSVTFGVSGRF